MYEYVAGVFCIYNSFCASICHLFQMKWASDPDDLQSEKGNRGIVKDWDAYNFECNMPLTRLLCHLELFGGMLQGTYFLSGKWKWKFILFVLILCTCTMCISRNAMQHKTLPLPWGSFICLCVYKSAMLQKTHPLCIQGITCFMFNVHGFRVNQT